MTSASPSPGRGPGDRVRLAHALRESRRRTRLSGVEAGKRAGMSQSKLSKIERGFLLPTVDDVTTLCHVYDVAAGERDGLIALASGLREEASSKIILARGVTELQRRIGHLEASASLVRGFQPAMVIGLLQTPAYMRCVFGTPDSQMLSPEEVAEAAAARIDRQLLLNDQSKRFVLIMTEGALRWQAGSAALMVDQVEAIARAAKHPNVRVGLIPWTTPVQVFPRHGFHLYDEDAVIVATEIATATMTGAADIATYLELFDALEKTAAFGEHAELHLARIADEYRQLVASA
jgi:transcriptional regulator with XRE-family HTH domain